MSSSEVPPVESMRPKQPGRSAFLLCLAGGIVTVTAFAGHIMSSSRLAPSPGAGIWGASIFYLLGMLLLSAALAIAALAWSAHQENASDPVKSSRSQLWLVFAALVVLHTSLAVWFCRPSPGVSMDTYTFQRDASWNFLHGIDPFGSTQANIYNPRLTALLYGPGEVVNGRVQVGLQYPPLTLFWVLPGYLLGDIRISYIIAVIISAWFVVAIYPGARSLWIASVLLFSPLTFLVELLCWTEPLVLMMLSATVYAAVKKRWWLPIALGLFLATKQYNFLALPFIGYFIRPFQWRAYWKLTGLSLAVALASVLPFAIWNLKGLWHDLVLFHLAQPFRQDAVSFAVPFPWMMKVGPVILLVFFVWAIRAGMRNAAMFAAAYGIALLIFVATSKQAFGNYYFLIGQAFFLPVAALPGISKKTGAERA
jgi:hypothetical protein